MKKFFLSALIILFSGCGFRPEISDQELALYPFQDNNTKLWGFIDEEGKISIEAEFEEASVFRQGLANVKIDGNWGLINHLGQIVVKPEYLTIKEFADNKTALVIDSDFKYFHIDRRGKKVIVPKKEYVSMMPFSEGLAAVEGQNEKWGFVDEEGEEVIETKFEAVGAFSNGIAQVNISEFSFFIFNTYINKEGKLLFQPELDEATQFSEGRAFIRIDGKLKLIGDKGQVIKELSMALSSKCNTDSIAMGYSEGLMGMKFAPGGKVSKWYNKCGFIDRDGNIVIDAQFREARQFNEGLAAVKIGDKWGYIDRQGNMVIEPKFAEAGSFDKRLAVVSEPPLIPWGYINQQGDYVWKSVEF